MSIFPINNKFNSIILNIFAFNIVHNKSETNPTALYAQSTKE